MGMSSWLKSQPLNTLLLYGVVFRLGLIAFGAVQDRVMDVKFTDVDYTVLTDAAQYVLNGDSPYRRVTYRYTPLLSYLMIPNLLLVPEWGKIVMAGIDVLCAQMTYDLVKMKTKDVWTAKVSCLVWLANPFVAVIGARGNVEALVCACILYSLRCARENRPVLAGAALGLAVHLKLYPVIYLPAAVLNMALFRAESQRSSSHSSSLIQNILIALLFLVSAVATFAISGLAMYSLYGQEFWQESYLYHTNRRDPRHNFSAFWYLQYLSYGREHLLPTAWLQLPTLAQMAMIGCFSLAYADRLDVCYFLITIAFVAFNKVATSQYFLWFLCLLPVVMPNMSMPSTMDGSWVSLTAAMVVSWLLPQLLWLASAYLLEFQGWPTFHLLFAFSMLQMLGYGYILIRLMQLFEPSSSKSKVS
eukprot:Clim_evm24s144 gene=Clim_evmTU24s144